MPVRSAQYRHYDEGSEKQANAGNLLARDEAVLRPVLLTPRIDYHGMC